MTPLALNLTSTLLDASACIQSVDLVDHLRVPTTSGLISLLADMHCFDCSEVLELALEIFHLSKDGFCIDPELTFLPAPKVWIEYRSANGPRIGHLLIENGGAFPEHYTFLENRNTWIRHGNFCLGNDAREIYVHADNITRVYLASILGCLALINTPRTIGREQFMPQRSLERRLLRRSQSMGKFPLNAWTEIKLEARLTPDEMSQAGAHEAHLTGKRCYHFCRAHLRIRNGRLEFVKSHWRGDPSLGLKHSRYLLVPPKGGSR
ncbi:hypothetical protein [Brucella sp. 2280]|uniref:hypothetical protein n=1 Tax=Brucella sp. 2280 TaxID=2592625 RepID=UPI001295D4FB|nr:hypothetical protein [Brucella sp. 2280]QGA57801.1 hypothetical protein GHC20_11805 [Brucella sp. 2280]